VNEPQSTKITAQITGEPREIERLTRGSEGGRWKRTTGYLAGGLPYGTQGFAAETGGAIPSSTVTGRGTFALGG